MKKPLTNVRVDREVVYLSTERVSTILKAGQNRARLNLTIDGRGERWMSMQALYLRMRETREIGAIYGTGVACVIS